MQARITYIDHSGFFMELPDVGFLFDYYQGEIPAMDTGKPLVVFVSHKHQDHYNPQIFSLVKRYPEIYFVLAKGIPVKYQIENYKKQGIALDAHLICMKKNSDFEFTLNSGRKLSVTTMKSTDEGVAFLVGYQDKLFYHAGDLNQWVWEGESFQYNQNMKMAYLREMEKLKGLQIDIAFVPLDPRLETHAFEGLEVFLEYAQAEKIFPMHFWGNFGTINSFLEKHPACRGKLQAMERAGQVFYEEL